MQCTADRCSAPAVGQGAVCAWRRRSGALAERTRDTDAVVALFVREMTKHVAEV